MKETTKDFIILLQGAALALMLFVIIVGSSCVGKFDDDQKMQIKNLSNELEAKTLTCELMVKQYEKWLKACEEGGSRSRYK